ncbi:MAG: 3,4-dihydroxy-2-butanone-4-phosphate synthase [Proteobacteria bacterium]|nr:3,4-dihydroxy-2-butanone-4-phosphate synthase [Pseudomonadota bacterium]
MRLATVEEAVEDIKAGKFVIVVDDEKRENEGDLVIAAQYATPEAINFMAQHGRGLICVSMSGEMLDRLGIPMMVPSSRNGSGFGTNFTVSVEAHHGVSTGISAFDRARTIEVLIDPKSSPCDIAMPGHIFPLRAKPGGVLERQGQTEASVDLACLAGLLPAGVVCEVMSASGNMARLPELLEFGEKHAIKVLTVEAMVKYRLEKGDDSLSINSSSGNVIRGASTRLPTVYGEFNVVAYRDLENNEEYLLLSMGEHSLHPPLVRLHSSCLTGDLLGSYRCDCGPQLQLALKNIAEDGNGILVYLKQEGRGIGLANKIQAYQLQDQGLDTVEANLKLGFAPDERSYDAAAEMLLDQGVDCIRLMTNNPQKIAQLEKKGIRVAERIAHEIRPNKYNAFYLKTKAEKLGHCLNFKD